MSVQGLMCEVLSIGRVLYVVDWWLTFCNLERVKYKCKDYI